MWRGTEGNSIHDKVPFAWNSGTKNNEMLRHGTLFLFFPLYVTPSPFSVPLLHSQLHKHTLFHSPCHFPKYTERNLLGLSDEECVGEEEKMSLLGLQAGL